MSEELCPLCNDDAFNDYSYCWHCLNHYGSEKECEQELDRRKEVIGGGISEIIKKWEEGKIPTKRLAELIAEVKGDGESE